MKKITTYTIALMLALACFAGIYNPAIAQPHVSTPGTAVPGASTPGTSQDLGEFSRRRQMALDRLTQQDVHPVFTQKFILADVAVNPEPPRRFYNFSGDLSGRYIEVMSLFPSQKNEVNLDTLVAQLLTYQQPDGRFGDPTLQFTVEQIGGEHMALLWGNGRLLVGLMTYYTQTQRPEVLEAGRRLGDFFINTYQVCSSPTVRAKLEGFGAKGIICFTQYIEGLVMLSQHTGDKQYAAVAAKTYPVLPARGEQHSHGYLSTLRGVLDLYEYTQDQQHLNFVLQAYQDLVQSEDYTLFGSVPEYFGGKGERDEGCSTADFMRLSFHLYRLTGKETYLDKGEKALYNAFYFNQYFTGDFGHHHITPQGAEPDQLHAAWWCCTMHGLRAMYEVQANDMVGQISENKKLNLYLETSYEDDAIAFQMSKAQKQGDTHYYLLEVLDVKDTATRLAFRQPPWAAAIKLSVNGKEITRAPEGGYVTLAQPLKKGDKISIALPFRRMLMTDRNKAITLDKIDKQTVTGILQYGPYLMGVDDRIDPTFNAEPNNNVVYATSLQPAGANMEGVVRSDVAISAQYQHGGFPSQLLTWLIPIAEQTYSRHGYLKMKMDFTTTPSQNEQDMLNPWQPK